MAVASLVLGLIALLGFWLPVIGIISLPCAVIGLILGVVGKKQLSAENKPSGMATAGIVLSIIALILSVLYLLICGACAAVLMTL